MPGAPRRRPPSSGSDIEDDPKLHAGEQHDDEARGGDQERRPKIWLHDDHPRRNGDHDTHGHQILERRRQRPFVHVPGAHHRYREFHDFGGLKADEADVEPTLRALADVAGHGHHDQQQDADHVGDRREQAQVLRGRQPCEGHAGRPPQWRCSPDDARPSSGSVRRRCRPPGCRCTR